MSHKPAKRQFKQVTHLCCYFYFIYYSLCLAGKTPFTPYVAIHRIFIIFACLLKTLFLTLIDISQVEPFFEFSY